MVFHTAPPQPASKARWTCAPELAGGADASQKGLGDLIPAKLILRSATVPHLANRLWIAAAASLPSCTAITVDAAPVSRTASPPANTPAMLVSHSGVTLINP